MESMCSEVSGVEKGDTSGSPGGRAPQRDQHLFTVHLLYVGHCTRHKGCKSVLNHLCSQTGRSGGNRTRSCGGENTRRYLYSETDAYTFSK